MIYTCFSSFTLLTWGRYQNVNPSIFWHLTEHLQFEDLYIKYFFFHIISFVGVCLFSIQVMITWIKTTLCYEPSQNHLATKKFKTCFIFIFSAFCQGLYHAVKCQHFSSFTSLLILQEYHEILDLYVWFLSCFCWKYMYFWFVHHMIFPSILFVVLVHACSWFEKEQLNKKQLYFLKHNSPTSTLLSFWLTFVLHFALSSFQANNLNLILFALSLSSVGSLSLFKHPIYIFHTLYFGAYLEYATKGQCGNTSFYVCSIFFRQNSFCLSNM